MSKSTALETQIQQLQAKLKQAKIDEEKSNVERVTKLVIKHKLSQFPDAILNAQFAEMTSKLSVKNLESETK
jgi:hypothetical protein